VRPIIDRKDVANLVLTLKELIPDYNPGSELLKTAFSSKPNHIDLTVMPKEMPKSLVN